MKDLIFKISLLVFLLSLLLGFYEHLPLIDNLVRSFVIFCLFFLAIWILMMVYVYTIAASHGQENSNNYKASDSKNVKTAN
ncbi:MAG: hypothetical protein Kow00108_11000 [Calditrichia bacterium]